MNVGLHRETAPIDLTRCRESLTANRPPMNHMSREFHADEGLCSRCIERIGRSPRGVRENRLDTRDQPPATSMAPVTWNLSIAVERHRVDGPLGREGTVGLAAMARAGIHGESPDLKMTFVRGRQAADWGTMGRCSRLCRS